MKNNILKIMAIMLISTILVTALSACGDKDQDSGSKESIDTNSITQVEVVADESYFEWDGNIIVALTDKGEKQETIKIPARCEGFSGAVFESSKVKSVVFEDDDDVELEFAFMGSATLTEVILPQNLVSIPSMCFQMCTSLKKIVIPAQVTNLGNYAFNACTSLSEVTFECSNLTIIGANSFEDCKSLKTVSLPASVQTIEKYAFFNCSSLESVTFGENVSHFAKYAFGNTAITEIYFPEELQIDIMDAGAFGTNAYATTVYIIKDSWCDTNRESWDVGFQEIKYK